MAYAENTAVAFEKPIAEIIGMLRRSGAEQIGQFESPRDFAVQFALNDRIVRFRLPLPQIADMPTHDGRRNLLTDQQRRDRREQAIRQRGRALMLVIKAKLESIESKVETFEEAFLANVVMADGATMYERIKEPLALEYSTGKVQAGSGLFLTGPSE